MDKTIFTEEYASVLRLLRQARDQASMTQAGLASQVGQTQSFVSKVERGERRLDVIELRTFCRAMGLTLAAFVRRLEAELAKTSTESGE
jgi:transcriptional regulator with XRE-family HTH domain